MPNDTAPDGISRAEAQSRLFPSRVFFFLRRPSRSAPRGAVAALRAGGEGGEQPRGRAGHPCDTMCRQRSVTSSVALSLSPSLSLCLCACARERARASLGRRGPMRACQRPLAKRRVRIVRLKAGRRNNSMVATGTASWSKKVLRSTIESIGLSRARARTSLVDD